MEKQHGTVLVFKPGLTAEEIKRRLDVIDDMLDQDYFCRPNGEPVSFHVHEFDPKYGGPVWYVP